jgi:AraC-like DNA-binding protein
MTDLASHIVEFSTDGIAARDRAAVWREYYGHVMMRVDLEPPPDMTFVARNRCLSLPGLQLMESSSSPVKVSRGGRYLADGNDDVVLAIARSGSIVINSGGREQNLSAGEAIALSGCEAASYHRVATGQSFTLRVPRATFESTVVSVEDVLMRPFRDRGALRLMEDYASWLMHAGTIDRQLLNLSVRHIHDLLALAIGPTAEFTDTARTRGLRAARLKLAKSWIASNSHRHDLSVAALATSLNVTPRYVQRLFETEGTTFSEFLLQHRLARAHRLLCEPQASATAIANIAYDVGFGDLSYFNRRFRRQFGMTPRDVRGDTKT